MPIFYTNWRFLTNAQAKDITMNYSEALETKLAEGKSVPRLLITATVKLQYNSSYNIIHHGAVFKTNRPLDIDASVASSDLELEELEKEVKEKMAVTEFQIKNPFRVFQVC